MIARGAERRVGWFAIATLAMVAILSSKPSFTNASRPPRGISNPVIAIEVARNVDEVDAILSDAPSPDREAMRLKTWIDFGFIVAYVGLFLAVARLLGDHVGLAAAATGTLAGICDVIENVGILRVVNADLQHTTQAMIDVIRIPSLIKWALVWITLALLAGSFWKMGHWSKRALAIVNFAAAALGMYGLFDNAFLVWAGFPMLAGLLGLAILYFRVG